MSPSRLPLGQRAEQLHKQYGAKVVSQRIVELRNIEFRNLYEEITRHSDRIESIITLSILSTGTFHGAILSLIFIKGGVQPGAESIVPCLFLLPLLFIVPSMILVASHLNSTVRVASYIQVFFEERLSNEGIGWQRNIQEVRTLGRAQRFGGWSHRRFLGWAIVIVLLGLSIFCIVPSLLSIVYFEHIKTALDNRIIAWYHGTAIGVFILSLSLAVSCRKAWSTKAFNEYITRWRELREIVKESTK